MEWGLSPGLQEAVPRARSGSGALQHSQALCVDAAAPCKAQLQSLQGSRAGTVSELYSLTTLLSKYLYYSFAIVCLPLSPPKK